MKNKIQNIFSLIGKKVSHKRIIGNSIILYFNEETLWIEPFWRYERNEKYMQGSQDFPNYKELTKDKYLVQFKKACLITNQIKNSKILNIEFHKATNDITINFEKKQSLQTFLASKDDKIWSYSNILIGIRIEAYLRRLEVGKVSEGTRSL